MSKVLSHQEYRRLPQLFDDDLLNRFDKYCRLTFIHVPKTGGKFIRKYYLEEPRFLQSRCSRQFKNLYQRSSLHMHFLKDYKKLPYIHDNIHFDCYDETFEKISPYKPLELLDNGKLLGDVFVAIIRDPVEQILSFYSYDAHSSMRLSDWYPSFSDYVKVMCFEDPDVLNHEGLSRLFELEAHSRFLNFQLFSDDGSFVPHIVINQRHLSEAVKMFDSYFKLKGSSDYRRVNQAPKTGIRSIRQLRSLRDFVEIEKKIEENFKREKLMYADIEDSVIASMPKIKYKFKTDEFSMGKKRKVKGSSTKKRRRLLRDFMKKEDAFEITSKSDNRLLYTLDDQAKLWLVRIPGVNSDAIEKLLIGNKNYRVTPKIAGTVHHHFIKQHKSMKALRDSTSCAFYARKGLKETDIAFTVLRHPYDMLKEIYETNWSNCKEKFTDFEHFILSMCSSNALVGAELEPFKRFLYFQLFDARGNAIPRFAINFEKLNQGLHSVAKRYQFDHIDKIDQQFEKNKRSVVRNEEVVLKDMIEQKFWRENAIFDHVKKHTLADISAFSYEFDIDAILISK